MLLLLKIIFQDYFQEKPLNGWQMKILGSAKGIKNKRLNQF